MGDVAANWAREGTHIGILSVDAGDEICEAMFLFVLVWDKEVFALDIATDDLEACFVGNPVAIPEVRGARNVRAGHVMEMQRRTAKRE
jgi:hypothetical protein